VKHIDDFRAGQGWFLDKDNKTGPLTMAFKRGKVVASPRHFHRSTHEYYLVLQGHATLEVNETEIPLGTNALVIVEPGEAHRLSAASDDFEVILIMERYAPDDKVILAEA